MSEGLSGMLWGNPVVVIAILLAEAWKKDGPKMTLGKIMSVDDMPFHYATDRYGDQVPLPCTERNVTTEKIDRATNRGFMPLVAPKARPEVRLASFRSVAGDTILGPWSGVQPVQERKAEARAQVQMSIPAKAQQAAEDDLDSLLAGFGDDAAPADPDSIDADLAALLEGL
jgi:pilus assembly protein FimV